MNCDQFSNIMISSTVERGIYTRNLFIIPYIYKPLQLVKYFYSKCSLGQSNSCNYVTRILWRERAITVLTFLFTTSEAGPINSNDRVNLLVNIESFQNRIYHNSKPRVFEFLYTSSLCSSKFYRPSPFPKQNKILGGRLIVVKTTYKPLSGRPKDGRPRLIRIFIYLLTISSRLLWVVTQ